MQKENQPTRGVAWALLALFALILVLGPLYLLFLALGWTWRGLTAGTNKLKKGLRVAMWRTSSGPREVVNGSKHRDGARTSRG